MSVQEKEFIMQGELQYTSCIDNTQLIYYANDAAPLFIKKKKPY